MSNSHGRFLFLVVGAWLFSNSLFAQVGILKPTMKEALVLVRMVNKEKAPRSGAHIIFEGKVTGIRYEDTTDSNGNFALLLPILEPYRVFFDNKGKIKEYDILQLENRKFQTYELLLIYEPAYNVIIENVLFETGEDIISYDSYDELNELVDLMRENQTIEIEISGHTDSVGSEAFNLRLSQRRADAVKEFIVEKGIDPNRILAIGYGESQPVASNNTEEGRTKNRRTEVKAISN